MNMKQKVREAFIKGSAAAAFMSFLIGGAALDTDPVAGGFIAVTSMAYLIVLGVQNSVL